jgi:hypothetical protein
LGGTKGARRKHVPLRIVPALGQIPQNLLESVSKEAWNILSQDPPRSNLANGTGELSPQTCTGTPNAHPAGRSRDRGVLAGEPAAEDVGRRELCFGDVPEVGDAGEARFKDPGRKGVNLTLPYHVEAAGPFQSESESFDAREEAPDAEWEPWAFGREPESSPWGLVVIREGVGVCGSAMNPK